MKKSELLKKVKQAKASQIDEVAARLRGCIPAPGRAHVIVIANTGAEIGLTARGFDCALSNQATKEFVEALADLSAQKAESFLKSWKVDPDGNRVQ